MTLSVGRFCLSKNIYSFAIFSSVGKEPGVFDMVIINDDLENAYEKLKSVLSEVKLFYLCKNIA